MFDATGFGAGTPVTASDTTYQDAATKGYAANRRPMYMQAFKSLRDNNASRGILDSGIQAQGEADLGNQFVQDVGGFRQNAALRGADIGEENRRIQQQRDWQVQDRDLQYKYLKDMMEQQKGQQEQQQRGQLIGTGVGAVASIFGGPLGFAAGNALGSYLGGRNWSDDGSDPGVAPVDENGPEW